MIDDNMIDISEENTHTEESQDVDNNINDYDLSKYEIDDNMKHG